MFNTKLADGSQALLLDIGSVGNLMCYGWARQQALLAAGQGLQSEEIERDKPLRVSGVGHGHKVCNKDGVVPICLRDTEDCRATGTFEAPLLEGEDMPALFGRVSLQRARSLIDTITNKVYMLGPGDYEEALEAALPPGTRTFQTEISTSGHMMLPCAKFTPGMKYTEKHSLKLHSELKLPVIGNKARDTGGEAEVSASSSGERPKKIRLAEESEELPDLVE